MGTPNSFSLTELLERETDKVVPVALPIGVINLLTQVRQSINDIEELAESIRLKGQLTQGIAVALTPRQARDYVRELNLIRGSKHKVAELVRTEIDGEEFYIILVAGHRRYNAVEKLLTGDYRQTKAFSGRYRATLHFGMSASDALSVQFQENRHRQVPVHEEAAAAWDYYRWQKSRNPKLTLKRFGKSIGRSASWVSTMVRFCSLPDSLQRLVSLDDAPIPYGILAEAARLAQGLYDVGKSMDESTLLSLVTHAVARKVTVAKFREEVSARLLHARNGQESLFSDLPEQKKPTRAIVQPELASFIYAALTWARQIDALRKQGAFEGPSEWAPETDASVLQQFSPGSPIRLSAELVAFLKQLLPHLEEIAAHEGGRHRKDLQQGEAVVEEAGRLLEKLGEVEIAVLEHA